MEAIYTKKKIQPIHKDIVCQRYSDMCYVLLNI